MEVSAAEITTRPATENELAHLRSRRSSLMGYVGCWLVVAVALASQLSLLVWILIDLADAWIGVLTGIVIATLGVAAWMRHNAPVDRRIRADLERAQVQVLRGAAESVWSVRREGDAIADTLVIALEDARCLILRGGFLGSEVGVPGEAEPGGRGAAVDDRTFNGLAAPYSFPSERFELTRFPTSGVVVRIDAIGAYQAPAALHGIDVRRLATFESLVVEASVEQLQSGIDTMGFD